VTKTILLVSGVMLAAAALLFRGTMPELVRYVRIRRM
jgi:hypothetical protein